MDCNRDLYCVRGSCCWVSWVRYLMGLFRFPEQACELSCCFPWSSLFTELWDLLGFLRNKSELWESSVFLWNTLVWVTAATGSKLKEKGAQKSRLFSIVAFNEDDPTASASQWIFLAGLWNAPEGEFFLSGTGFAACHCYVCLGIILDFLNVSHFRICTFHWGNPLTAFP